MSDKKPWTEYFRLITPFFLFVLSIIAGSINGRLGDIDTKLFRHLTNDEIHTPKSMVLTRAEFNIYQEFRNKQNEDLKCSLGRIENMLSERRENNVSRNSRQ